MAVHTRMLVLLLLSCYFSFGLSMLPTFREYMENMTLPEGQDATFTCKVNDLGNYRVAWIRADTKTMLAIHVHVVTQNKRISVGRKGNDTWTLSIQNVRRIDSGQYYCQVNTEHMIMLMATLEVVIPPNFLPEETSNDITVVEGTSVKLLCTARGYPKPKISWRKKHDRGIVSEHDLQGVHNNTEPQGMDNNMEYVTAEILSFANVTRSKMGMYVCSASNGVPPSVNKMIKLNVH